MPKKRTSKAHGGARTHAGRPPKLDKELWGQITCTMRHDTIARLRAGAGSRFFGEFLQEHLDRFPPPTREQYLLIQQRGNRAIHRPRIRYRSPVTQPWMSDPSLSYQQRLAIALNPNSQEAYQKLLNDHSRKTSKGRALAHQKR